MNLKEKGITRLPCFLLLVLASLAGYGVKLQLPAEQSYYGDIVTYVLITIILYFRLKNIGWNPLYCLFGLFPFVNLFLLLPAISFPENYANEKKLDLAGKVLIGLLMIVYILPTFIFSTMVTVNKQVHGSLSEIGQNIKEAEKKSSEGSKAP